MSIVSSTYTIDAHTQADGSKYVVEQHTDSAGRVYTFGPYRVWSESAAITFLNNRVAKINDNLAKAEAEAIFATNEEFNLTCQTGAELANRVVGGSFTSNDVRLSYNTYFNKSLNLAQWNDLITNRLIPARDRYQAILDEAPL